MHKNKSRLCFSNLAASVARKQQDQIGLLVNWARKVRELIIDVGQNNRRYRKVAFYIPEEGRRRKRRKIFEKGIRIYIFYGQGDFDDGEEGEGGERGEGGEEGRRGEEEEYDGSINLETECS